MSRALTDAATVPFAHAWSLLEAYVKVCPDEIWEETHGGWPVWQQALHAVTVLDFFTRGDAPPLPAPAPQEVLMLTVQGAETVDKAGLRAYMAAVKARVDAWLAALDDAALSVRDDRLSAALGMEISAVWVLIMLASHTQYHLGSCDAALRDHGLPGVF